MIHKNFITPVGIGSYVHLLEPVEQLNGEMKYDLALIISKDDVEGIKAIKSAIVSAFKEKFGEDKKKHPKVWDNCLRDGDDKDNSEGTVYENAYYINAKSQHQPGIVGPNGRPLFNVAEEVYSGMLCRLSVNFYGWKNAGKSGVGVGLNNVMKTGEGERLDGKLNAENEFAAFAVEDEGEDDILDS